MEEAKTEVGMKFFHFVISTSGMGAIILSVIFVTGCTTADNNIQRGEIPSSSVTDSPTVPEQPIEFYLKKGEGEKITFYGNNIKIEYSENQLEQIIYFTFNEDEQTITKEPIECTSPCGFYWSKDNIHVVIEPVIWELNEKGEKVWSFRTWDTKEVYVEIYHSGASDEPLPDDGMMRS